MEFNSEFTPENSSESKIRQVLFYRGEKLVEISVYNDKGQESKIQFWNEYPLGGGRILQIDYVRDDQGRLNLAS